MVKFNTKTKKYSNYNEIFLKNAYHAPLLEFKPFFGHIQVNTNFFER